MGNQTYQYEDQLKATVATLSNKDGLKNMCHMRWRGEPLPSQTMIKEIIDLCRSVLFPGFFGDSEVNGYNVEYIIGLQCERLNSLLESQVAAGLIFNVSCERSLNIPEIESQAREISSKFISTLPELRRVLHTDIEATYIGDPAAVSHEEVIYCYPALRAISNYRIAHSLLVLGVPIIPRMISEMAHSETGIDIHPGATIGECFSIDHGTGVVVGATAIIGKNVKLYQGVTLGAKSFEADENNNPIKGIPRHPIIGDNVIVYSNTSILGRITIGRNATIGGNIWVTDDVAEGEKLVQAKANNILRLKSDEGKI
ncbi:MAG: serine acetyltransferase [Muribaculaceae bacterium]